MGPGGAEAIGPILLGMRRPVTVLQRNSSVETVVHMAAITVAAARRLELARDRAVEGAGQQDDRLLR